MRRRTPSALVVPARCRQVRPGVHGVRREVQDEGCRATAAGYRRKLNHRIPQAHMRSASRTSAVMREGSMVIRGRSIGTRTTDPDPVSQERKDPVEPKGARSYVAELVGTFLLVLFICLVVSLTSKAALGFTDWAVIGLVHAFMLALLVAAMAGRQWRALQPRRHARADRDAQVPRRRRGGLHPHAARGRNPRGPRRQGPAAGRGPSRQLGSDARQQGVLPERLVRLLGRGPRRRSC